MPADLLSPSPPAAPALAAAAAPSAAATPPGDPVLLHPALWRAAQLGRSGPAGLATGFAALDAVLPASGWPVGSLTELLLPHPGVGEWRLLAPVLAALQRGSGPDGVPRPVMLFDPPGQPCAWTLRALGLDLRQLVLVQGPARPAPSLDAPPRGAGAMGADILWSLEQALASGQVGAALAWLPARLPPDALRRLQLAAQAHPGPVFLFREVAAGRRPSAAPLRLQLAPGEADALQVLVLKRRGPPLSAPVVLALPPVLSPLARERSAARQRPAAARPAAPGHASRPGRPDRPAPAVA